MAGRRPVRLGVSQTVLGLITDAANNDSGPAGAPHPALYGQPKRSRERRIALTTSVGPQNTLANKKSPVIAYLMECVSFDL